jgi:hypothetical protein
MNASGSGGSGLGGAGATGAGGSAAGPGAAAAAGDAPQAGILDASDGAAGATDAAVETGSAGTNDASSDTTADRAAGGDPTKGETPPWRALNITVDPGQHVHTLGGHSAGFDNRAAKMAAKLIVDLAVAGGGYQPYLGKRGFHVMGVTFTDSPSGYHLDPNLSRDVDGDYALNILDGHPHGDQHTVTPDQSVMTQVLTGLKMLEQTFPGEGWGYFLTQDLGAVRWSDVGFTGFQHGANPVAIFAHALFVYRAVSQSGPFDDHCGPGMAKGDFDPNNLPYDPNCAPAHIASWLDSPSVTPMDRYFGFAGKADVSYGDILFAMDRMHYVGTPVNITTAQAPYGGSHRFYAETGSVGFSNNGGFPIDAINIAFGVLPENLNPTF